MAINVFSSRRCFSAVFWILDTSNINGSPDKAAVIQKIECSIFVQDVMDVISLFFQVFPNQHSKLSLPVS